jgi:peptidoglycan/xylan/chitin deacetylase (PgdA/CDA1 family)
MAAVRVRGDEIVGHGRTNAERQGTLDEAAERALIGEATSRLSEAEGRKPEGWLGPWISHSHRTPDLLAEAGYRYLLDWCMDDQPIWFRCRGGKRILAVPYPQEVNDIPAIVARKMGAEAFADMIVDQFDEMLELSEARPLVMGVALHAYLVGQPHRLRHLKRALRHIAARREAIWLTTPGAIARHCESLPAGTIP